MSDAPTLLGDDGSASIATGLLMSHHALRRDIARFSAALQHLGPADHEMADALRGEWQSYRATLHRHHMAEDNGIFPSVLRQEPSLAPVIERLTADHQRIDPLLTRGDDAFAALPDARGAAAVVSELAQLLSEHLAVEEAEVVRFLRDVKEFPPPASEAELDLYAQGFAWSSHGVAPEVLDRVYAMLPEALRSRLPAARDAFAARCERVWGSSQAGASRTAVPDR